MTKAEGTFSVDTWDPTSIDEAEGAKLARVHLTKTFMGDLTGTSSTDILTVQADKLDSLAYAGFERFIGSAHGRSGTFMLRHNATSLGEESSLSWIIVPGSGTGELTGITGAGKIDASDGVHVYSLEYEL